MIGRNRVFIIAEAGVNHDGSVEDALRLVDVAAEAGADAVKFQTFDAAALLTPRALKADYQARAVGEDGGQLDMIRRLELDREAFVTLAEHCRARGIAFMSTAFDMGSLEFLSGFDLPAVKIPSGDLTWGSMLLTAARLGRPLIVSTGMATLDEVRDALAVVGFGLTQTGDPKSLDDARAVLGDPQAQAALREQVVLLHCTSQYPAPPHTANLRAMTTLAETFGLAVGYSDHTAGLTAPVAAVALGARVIEKHFTLDRARHGPDHAASLEPGELAELVRRIRETETLMGSPQKRPASEEADVARVARRALTAARPIKAGEAFDAGNVTAKRPSDGLSPMAFWRLAGRAARRDYALDEAIEAGEIDG